MRHILTLIMLLRTGDLFAESDLLKMHATLAVLPRSEPCGRELHAATALYRVNRVVQGRFDGRTIRVSHRCPELPRGPSWIGSGDAPALRVGTTYLLSLRPAPRAQEQASAELLHDQRPIYTALQTDRSTWPPQIVVVIEGGGGAQHKLSFESDSVRVGSALDADVLLGGRDIAKYHILIEVRGERLTVRPLAPGARIRHAALEHPTDIGFRDTIVVGTYRLRAALIRESREP